MVVILVAVFRVMLHGLVEVVPRSLRSRSLLM